MHNDCGTNICTNVAADGIHNDTKQHQYIAPNKTTGKQAKGKNNWWAIAENGKENKEGDRRGREKEMAETFVEHLICTRMDAAFPKEC